MDAVIFGIGIGLLISADNGSEGATALSVMGLGLLSSVLEIVWDRLRLWIAPPPSPRTDGG